MYVWVCVVRKKHFVYARAQPFVYKLDVVASENNDKIVLNIFNGSASFNWCRNVYACE